MITVIQKIRLGLVSKLIISFFLVISISVAVPTFQSYINLTNTNQEINQTRDANEKVRMAENADTSAGGFQDNLPTMIDYASESINNAKDTNSSLYSDAYKGYTYERDTTTSYFKALTDNAPTMLAQLHLDSFGKEYQTTITTLDNLIANATSGDTAAASASFKTYQAGLDKLKGYSAQFRQYTIQQLNNARTDLNGIYQRIQTNNNNQQVLLLVFSAILFVVAALFSFIVINSITRPLRSLVRRLEGLAEGNLTAHLYVANRDEFGRVAATFNSSVEKLNRLISRLQHEANNIGRASAQINKASQEQAHSFAQQTTIVGELMSKVESLAEISRGIDSSSNEVAEQAQQATHSAEYGQEAVRQSVKGMAEIEATVKEIVKRILTLNEKTQDAGKLIAVIQSIAEETHLLALNAAIESSATGEEGSRFGVVASHVKQLANRTREAVKSTQIILHEIQLAAGSSVMATEQGLKRATEGMELARQSGEANQTILYGVSRTAELSQSISNATTVQLQATEDLVVTMRGMTETISENAFGAQQTTISAAQLDEIVEQLLIAAREFQLTNTLLPERSKPTPALGSAKSGHVITNEGTPPTLNPAKT